MVSTAEGATEWNEGTWREPFNIKFIIQWLITTSQSTFQIKLLILSKFTESSSPKNRMEMITMTSDKETIRIRSFIIDFTENTSKSFTFDFWYQIGYSLAMYWESIFRYVKLDVDNAKCQINQKLSISPLMCLSPYLIVQVMELGSCQFQILKEHTVCSIYKLGNNIIGWFHQFSCCSTFQMDIWMNYKFLVKY